MKKLKIIDEKIKTAENSDYSKIQLTSFAALIFGRAFFDYSINEILCFIFSVTDCKSFDASRQTFFRSFSFHSFKLLKK